MEYFKKLCRWAIKRQKWIAPALLLTAALGYLSVQGDIIYVFDAEGYNRLSNSFIQNGVFSFANFPADYRGYFFPFLLFLFKYLLGLLPISETDVVAFGGSLFAVAVFSFVIPRILRQKTNGATFVLRVVPFCFFLLWWSDTLFYPLTDMWAAGLILFAMLCLLLLEERACDLSIKNLLLAVASGVLLYGAYNTRTIYLFLLPFLVGIFIIANRHCGPGKLLFCLGAMLAGFLLCALPQLIINRLQFHDTSILVNTELKMGEGTNLFLAQLRGGIFLQRYDTYVGEELGSIGGIYYLDAAGLSIREMAGLTERQLSGIGEYIGLVLRYPLDFLGIYGRHFINALHLPFHEVNITKLHNHNGLYTLANYCICYLGGAGVIYMLRTRLSKLRLWGDTRLLYLLCMLIPCICILPGAIETRFFIPGYLLVYVLVAWCVCKKEFWRMLGEHRLLATLLFLVCLVACCSVWGATFASVETLPMLISR